MHELTPLAVEMDLDHLLSPIYSVLELGNQSMKWLRSCSEGKSVEDVVKQSIIEMKEEEIVSIKSKAIFR